MALSILVVEDDVATRDMLVQALAGEGYDTVTARDVPTAMRVLTDRRPDLLITDIRLDTYNGLQLIAMAPTPIRAIVLTGFADPAIEADARRLGAEYLVKPVPPSVLCEVVARTLARAAQTGVFREARRAPRCPVTTPVSVQVGPHTAQLLDVSTSGMRLEVHCLTGQGLPTVLTLRFLGAGDAVRVDVVWKRRISDTAWLCGAALHPSDEPQWQRLLSSL